MKAPSLRRNRHRQILPGFGLTLGYTVFYLTLIVLLPFTGLIAKSYSGTWEHFWKTVSDPQVLASFRLSFGASFLAAIINGVFGLAAAWVLVRYEFPGRRVVDALVDFPFALPTAVAGIALTTLYSENGWLGAFFKDWSDQVQTWAATQENPNFVTTYLADFGLKTAYSPTGVLIALTFIGLPFVVRTLQPVIQDLSIDVEEAAACLGANRWQTFSRVIFPAILPALLTGIMLAFGRAVGEFGSVVFISGNLPYKTEITPWLIVSKLEQFDYTGAAALGVVMLLTSFLILLVINALEWWASRQQERIS
jgi:sulfate transport system permease protein